METEVASETSGLSLQERLDEINEKLLLIGATPAFCRTYFMSHVGRCDETRACECVRHIAGVPALPSGMVCSQVFGTHLVELKTRLKWVGAETDTYRKLWHDVRAEETAAGLVQGQTGRKVTYRV